jgi:hypothetical protein
VAKYTEDPTWVEDVDTYATDTSLLGGDEDSPLNRPIRDLFKRTAWARSVLLTLGLSAQHGSDTFDPESGTTITHNLGHSEYAVDVIPTEDPGGELGEVWVDIQDDDFTIHNSGTFDGGLRWKLIVGTEAGE